MVLTERAERWRARTLAAPSLALAALPCFVSVTDPDYGWHLATGRLIARTGHVPRVDPFSFTRAGAPWTDHEWLTQMLLAWLDRLGGYVLCACVFALAAALSVGATWGGARVRGGGAVPSALAALVCALLARPTTNVRPLMVTTLLCATLQLVCGRAVDADRRRLLLVLPPMFALWANLHGGFIAGLVLFACITAGDALDAWRGLPAIGPRILGAVFVASVLATLATPWGASLWSYALQYSPTRSQLTRYVDEWIAPSLRAAESVPLLLALAALVAVLVVRPRRLRAADALPANAFAALALRSLRHAPLFAVIALPTIAARATELWPALARPLTRLRWPVPFAVALVPCLLGAMVVGHGATRQLGARASSVGYPADGASWLEARPALARVVSMYHWGGYLIEREWPARRVFIDGRADMYGSEFMDDAIRVFAARPGWEQRLDAWNIQAALVERGSRIDVALARSPAWTRAFVGSVEDVYVRR